MKDAPLHLRFHHMGLAVRSDETAAEFLTWMGYVCGPLVYDLEQDVRLRMCEKTGAPSVEIVTFGKGDGPLSQMLKRFDQLIYHTCYEVDDRDRALVSLENSGFRVTLASPPRPAILFGNRLVSFHLVPGFGLIELLSAQ